MLFDHVDRNAQDDGAALGLRAPERPGGVGGGGLRPTHALGNRADRRRQGGLIYLEVRPERPVGMSAASTISGVRAFAASARPVSVFVKPGP